MVDLTVTQDGDEAIFDAYTAEGEGWMGRSQTRMPRRDAKAYRVAAELAGLIVENVLP
jgi:hypothetical protein